MQSSVLVLTPQAAFGELIRQSLEETGRYRVEVVSRAAEGIERCGRGSFQLVLLDSDLPDVPLEQLAAEVRAARQGARIAAFLPQTDGEQGALAVDAVLGKPFYLPDLLTAVRQLTSPEPAGEALAESAAGDGGSRLSGAEEDEALLARTAAASQALGAVLLRGGEVRAVAGCADGEWSRALAGLFQGRGGDLPGPETVTYRPAPGGSGSVLVYAVGWGEDGLLALLFDEGVPYSAARARARQALQRTGEPPAG
ncbi:MAG TPA: hypothetical protein VF813_05970 [Anaerolineaceae bacterium]